MRAWTALREERAGEAGWRREWLHEGADGRGAHWRAQKRTLAGGRSEGVEEIVLESGDLRAIVLPTRGMAIWNAAFGGIALGWRAPAAGPVHPAFVPLAEPSGMGWLEGFDEWLCRCGLGSNGAPEWDRNGVLRHGLHGRIGNRPAHRLRLAAEPASGALELAGEVDETRLFARKLRLRSSLALLPDADRLEIADEIVNLSGEPADAQLLYHVNFGAPLAGEGARLVAAVRELCPRDAAATARAATWNRLGEAEAGRPEEVFFAEVLADPAGEAVALLLAPGGGHGVRLRWDARALPCFSLWKNPQLAADGCVTGLEPATNFPNARGFEERHGRVVRLAAGATQRFTLAVEPLRDAAAVDAACATVARLQADAPPLLHARPRAGWSPHG